MKEGIKIKELLNRVPKDIEEIQDSDLFGTKEVLDAKFFDKNDNLIYSDSYSRTYNIQVKNTLFHKNEIIINIKDCLICKKFLLELNKEKKTKKIIISTIIKNMDGKDYLLDILLNKCKFNMKSMTRYKNNDEDPLTFNYEIKTKLSNIEYQIKEM